MYLFVRLGSALLVLYRNKLATSLGGGYVGLLCSGLGSAGSILH